MNLTATVVGAGVVGLSTALCLQDKGFKVTIIAEKFGANTTSHVAGGLFLPYNRKVLGEDRVHTSVDIVKQSWRHYSHIVNSIPEHVGVLKLFGYQCYFTEDYGDTLVNDPLCWEAIDVLRKLTVEELKRFSPTSPCTGWLVQTFIIQCQYYLPYLMNEFRQHGGLVIEKRLTSLTKIPLCDVIVNCCGLGAKDLCNDVSVYPSQGQVAHAQAPHIKHFYHCEEVVSKPPEKRQLLYILPQTDHVILGGTFIEHGDSMLVSADVKNSFIHRLSAVIPSVLGSKVSKEECGLRPTRDILRLETEEIRVKDGRILKVIHNYGHGGNGIALSWGTAEIASNMAVNLLSTSKL